MAEYPLKKLSFHTGKADRSYAIKPHIHNFWQFYYLLSGDVEITVADKSIRLWQGDGILVSPGKVRAPKCAGLPPKYIFVFFENVSLNINGMPDKLLHANPHQQDMCKKLYQEIEFPQDRNSPQYMTAIFLSLLIELRRSLEHENSPSQAYYEEIVSRVDTYMQTNLHLPLTRKDLAKIAHVSSPHLARIFRNIMEATPLERLTQLRMEHAKFLLSQSTRSIVAISGDIGYESISHFSRSFKRYSGKTPTQYRKELMEP